MDPFLIKSIITQNEIKLHKIEIIKEDVYFIITFITKLVQSKKKNFIIFNRLFPIKQDNFNIKLIIKFFHIIFIGKNSFLRDFI